MKKKGWIYGGAAAATLVGAFLGMGNYFYNFALKSRKKKEFLEEPTNVKSNPAIDPEVEARTIEKLKAFHEAVRPRTVTLFSNEAKPLKLKAKYVEQSDSSHRWVILVHGYSGSSNEMIRWAEPFYNKGFHILAPDLRGHGDSDGDYIGMGWPDRLDIVNWINWIHKRDENPEIVLLGLSMGAATVMNVAGEQLPSSVRAIIEDCGFSSASAVFTHQLDEIFGLPAFPAIPGASVVTRMRAGYDLYQASPLEQVKKTKIPMLFIHGMNDTFVPFEMMKELYEAAGGPKEKLAIEHAGHAESVFVNPTLYWETVWNFVNQYVPTTKGNEAE